VLLVLVILFSISIARNMFRICSVNRAARKAVLSAIEAIPREGSDDNIKRSNLVDNNSGKETLLLLEMFIEPSKSSSRNAKS
jgi:hypothetical protein